MSISSSIDAARFHAEYARLSANQDETAADISDTIDKAFAGIGDAFKAAGYRWDNCDAAEEMVACVTRYFFQSNPSFRALIPPAR